MFQNGYYILYVYSVSYAFPHPSKNRNNIRLVVEASSYLSPRIQALVALLIRMENKAAAGNIDASKDVISG